MSFLLLLLAGNALAHPNHQHEHHKRAGSALERRADVSLTDIVSTMNSTALPVPVNAPGSVPPGLANAPPLPECEYLAFVFFLPSFPSSSQSPSSLELELEPLPSSALPLLTPSLPLGS